MDEIWARVKQYNENDVEASVFNSMQIEGAAKERSSFYALYGGLFFLGLFMGAMFLMRRC